MEAAYTWIAIERNDKSVWLCLCVASLSPSRLCVHIKIYGWRAGGALCGSSAAAPFRSRGGSGDDAALLASPRMDIPSQQRILRSRHELSGSLP